MDANEIFRFVKLHKKNNRQTVLTNHLTIIFGTRSGT